MLLPTMTYKEMYDNLSKDLKKVKIREDYFLPKAMKEFKKERRFPAWRWYEYTVPASQNKYIIFFYKKNFVLLLLFEFIIYICCIYMFIHIMRFVFVETTLYV